MNPRALLLLLPILSASLAFAGCASETPAEDGDQSEDALEHGTNKDRWLYNGVLPHLDHPSIVVAQTSHTVRITGSLPSTYDKSKLPFYAQSLDKDGKLSVVYPIATGSAVNHQPSTYVTERVYPRRSDSSAPWGGFPFISYVDQDPKDDLKGSPFQGIAFHGPITAADGEWKLIRGPVSHGCNRMQGEHVVELAHLIGVDMTTRVWGGEDILKTFKVPVTVIRGVPDTWNGQSVDVDYPALASVKRPTTNVAMFKSWKSTDFPTWVCKYNGKDSSAPADYCTSQRHLVDKADALTGAAKPKT